MILGLAKVTKRFAIKYQKCIILKRILNQGFSFSDFAFDYCVRNDFFLMSGNQFSPQYGHYRGLRRRTEVNKNLNQKFIFKILYNVFNTIHKFCAYARPNQDTLCFQCPKVLLLNFLGSSKMMPESKIKRIKTKKQTKFILLINYPG